MHDLTDLLYSIAVECNGTEDNYKDPHVPGGSEFIATNEGS